MEEEEKETRRLQINGNGKEKSVTIKRIGKKRTIRKKKKKKKKKKKTASSPCLVSERGK
jgi:hypothetical protein